MAANTNLRTTINFGARIDSSFTGATGALNKALKGIGTETARNRTLQTAWGQQLARTLNGAAGETEKLSRAQDTLKKSIQEATLAGRETSRLKRRYADISRELEHARRVQDRLTDSMRREIEVAERAERVEARRARIRNHMRAGAGLAMRGSGRLAGIMGHGLMNIGKWASAGVLAGGAAAIASPIMLNAQTAEELGQARGYGMSIEKYKAGGALAAQFGLNAENYGDLAEESTNKIWEDGNEKTLNPLLQQLGLSKGVVVKMGRQKAFDLLMQKLSTMKNGAAAASLADQLMGGEANKLLTGLHTIGKTYNQAMQEANRYNLLTHEGAEGAMQASTAVNRLWGVAESGMQDTVGKITKELVPSIDDASVGLAKWIKDMQPQITSAVIDWIKPDGNGKTGPQRLWDGMVKFGQGAELIASEVMAVAERLKWILPEGNGGHNSPAEITKKAYDMAYNEGMKKADKKGVGAWYKPWSWGDRKEFVEKYARENTGKYETVLGATDTAHSVPAQPGIPFRAQPQQNYNDHRNITITVNAAPGQSTEDVGKSVYDAFLKSLPGGGESFSGNNAFDMPSL